MRIFVLFLCAVWIFCPARVESAEYPDCTIRVLVPLPTGSSGDTLARVFAEALSSITGKAVTVENRPGASGSLVAKAIASATPDGCTLGITTPPMLWPIAIGGTAGHDPKDMGLISELARYELFLVVERTSTFHDVGGIIKKNPSNYSGPHVFGTMAGAQLATISGIHALNVGDQRTGERGAVLALLQAHEEEKHRVSFAFLYGPTISGLVGAGGSLRVVATTASVRSPFAPDTPSIGEALPSWQPIEANLGLAGPRGMPRHMVEKIYQDAKRASQSPAYIHRLKSLWSRPVVEGPVAFEEYVLYSRAIYMRFGTSRSN